MIYPGGRTSIRFEHLIAGIQAYEKIKILRKEFVGNKIFSKNIEQILNSFDEVDLKKNPASNVITKAKEYIDNL